MHLNWNGGFLRLCSFSIEALKLSTATKLLGLAQISSMICYWKTIGFGTTVRDAHPVRPSASVIVSSSAWELFLAGVALCSPAEIISKTVHVAPVQQNVRQESKTACSLSTSSNCSVESGSTAINCQELCGCLRPK